MDDAKLKQLLQDDLEREAEQIIEEVGSDQSLADVEAPQEIHDKLFQQIREYEKEKSRKVLSAEEEELIRLGKVYRRTRKRNRYLVLAAAAIAVLAVGITSFGGPMKVYETVKYMVSGREQTNISEDNERVGEIEVANEEEAYKLIENKFGYMPPRLDYLPSGMEFEEVVVEEESQTAKMFYVGENDKVIVYTMFFNYRTSSVGYDTNDKIIHEYTEQVLGRTINVKQYKVSDGSTNRWKVEFEEQKMYGFLNINGLTENETASIIKNLHFFK